MKAWLLLLCLLPLPATPCATSSAWADDITVLSAGAISSVAREVAPHFEASTGHRVILRNDTVGALVRRIKGNEAYDATLMSPAGLQSLGGLIAQRSQVVLARVGVGVGVRDGTPPPDIHSVDAFRSAMLGARAVAYIDPASGGSSGIYVASLFRRLGIDQAMAPKSVLVHGGLAADAVTDGRADLVLQQISEIMSAPGVTLVGPLPSDIQMETTYAGAVASGTAHPDAARAFLAALTSPDARAVMSRKGLNPP